MTYLIGHMDRLFQIGTYHGQGHWVDQKSQGSYRAQYRITDRPDRSKAHEVRRVFLEPDGSVAYEECTTVSFEPRERGALWVSIQGQHGTVAGPGYAFAQECHYDLDVTPDNHLEFTFRVLGNQLRGMGSATDKGNRTYWEETLTRLRKQYYFRPSSHGYYAWDVDRLIGLTAAIKPQTVRLGDIAELSRPFCLEGSNAIPTYRQIAEDARLIAEADLSFPIIMAADRRVMDGMHRVMKALSAGHETIEAVILDHDPEPDYVDVHPDQLSY